MTIDRERWPAARSAAAHWGCTRAGEVLVRRNNDSSQAALAHVRRARRYALSARQLRGMPCLASRAAVREVMDPHQA